MNLYRPFLVCALLSACFRLSTGAATNEWTKPTSGAWEEPNWSLGILPAANQDLVSIANAGWKAVAIGAGTALNHPASLTVKNLRVDAPADSFSQLLLNWAGHNVSLTVTSNFLVGANGSLASHGSSMKAQTLLLQGEALLADGSGADIGQVVVDSAAQLTLNNAFLSSSNVTVLSGNIQQEGGAHAAGFIHLPGLRAEPWLASSGSYSLSNGVLYSGQLTVGIADRFSNGVENQFHQSGGAHTNTTLILNGWIYMDRFGRIPFPSGEYVLNGGVLASDSVLANTGSFVQNGGTNSAGLLQLTSGARYALSGGRLVTSQTSVSYDPADYVASTFTQTGGTHLVTGVLRVQESSYLLGGGALTVPVIELRPQSTLHLAGGQVSNADRIFLENGTVRMGELNVQLGRLALASGRLDLDPQGMGGPSQLRFADSRDLAWTGMLQVLNWHPTYDRIFVGTSAQALTAAQLEKIVFNQPYGWPIGIYPAELKPTGELVPRGAGQTADYTYFVSNGVATITGYLGTQPVLALPSSIAGLPVRQIGDFAFSDLGFLNSVSLPSSITNIGRYAFFRCTNLTAVTLVPGVVTIGEWAFGSCSNLLSMTLPDTVETVGGYVFFACTRLSSLKLSSGMSELSFGLLENCASLPRLEIPTNIISVQPFALSYCSSLTNLNFPEGLWSIDDLACHSSTALRTVTIPSTTTNIGLDAFGNCSSLEFIAVAPLNPSYASPDGVLFDKAISTLIRFPAGRAGSYRVPEGVQAVYNWAFQFSSNLVSVTLPASVKYLYYSSFANCPSLTAIYCEGDAPWVADNAFDNSPNVVLYHLNGTTGWGSTLGGRPTAVWYLPAARILTGIAGFGMQPSGFSFAVSGPLNSTVVIQTTANLANPAWVSLSTNTLATGALYFVDPQVGHPARFYRVIQR